VCCRLRLLGLPLAEAFAEHVKTMGFDINESKLRSLNDANNQTNLAFTSDPAKIKEADFVLICVPTPVTNSKEPDLSSVKSAAEIVGENLKKGAELDLMLRDIQHV